MKLGIGQKRSAPKQRTICFRQASVMRQSKSQPSNRLHSFMSQARTASQWLNVILSAAQIDRTFPWPKIPPSVDFHVCFRLGRQFKRDEQRQRSNGEGAGWRSDCPCLRCFRNARPRAARSAPTPSIDGNCWSGADRAANRGNAFAPKGFRGPLAQARGSCRISRDLEKYSLPIRLPTEN